MTFTSRFLTMALLVLTAGIGCSKGPSLKTVPVSGKVTLDGQPLAGASVVFHGEMASGAVAPPPPSTGITGADGTYKLSTMASGSQVAAGAPPGTYKVTITKQSGPVNPGAGTENMTPEQMREKMANVSPEDAMNMSSTASSKAGSQSGSPKSEIPARYGRADDSGFTATVGASGAQTFDFPLTSE